VVIRADINTFVDEVYRPYAIQKSMEDFRLIEMITAASEPGPKPDALEIMDLYVTEVIAEIEGYRQELLQPISERQLGVLTAIDDSYQKLQNANAIVIPRR
jgi:hypothetical protein